MKKIVISTMMVLLSAMPAAAQRIAVKSSSDGMPLTSASVFNEKGEVIGMTDGQGETPDLRGAAHIRVTCLGYKTAEADVSSLNGELLVDPVVYAMGEVESTKPKASRLKLTCYFRVYHVFNKPVRGSNTKSPQCCIAADGVKYLYVPYRTDQIAFTTDVTAGFRSSDIFEIGADNLKAKNFSLYNSTKVEQAKQLDPKKYSVEEKGSLKEVYRLKKGEKKLQTRILTDTLSKSIHCEYLQSDGYSYQAKYTFYDESGELKTWKGMASDVSVHEVYRMTPYDKVRLSDLAAMSYTQQFCGVADGGTDTLNYCFYAEYYPVQVELLTKEEYASEKKNISKVSAEEIEQYMKEAQVQELPADIQELLRKSTVVRPAEQAEGGRKEE